MSVTTTQRSKHIIEFVLSHPALNTSMLCRLVGGYDAHNFANALNGNRNISAEYVPRFEKVLIDYGYEPLK